MNKKSAMTLTNPDRRRFLAASLGALSLAALPAWARPAGSGTKAHIVIAGGGVGGCTVAKYLKLFDPDLWVTVVERNPVYLRPYGSSEVLTGHVDMADLRVSYDLLKERYGIEFVIDAITGFDPTARTLTTAGGQNIGYDRLIVAPGIQLLYDAYEGLSEEIAEQAIPAAWIPGLQTALLAKQLQGMRQGGTFVLVAPPNPYRCPPGPYERAALAVEWLRPRNPRAKVILLDPKDSFVTDETMLLGWNRLYDFNLPPDYRERISPKVEVREYATPGMLSWVRGQDGGRLIAVDAVKGRVETETDTIAADVINVIPPMQAGKLAHLLGLTDGSGWCPVTRRTFASSLQPQVHVIGDACIADAMPKSGFSANTQAKTVARAIVEELAGRPTPVPVWENTCYALAGSDYGLFVADVFRLVDGKIARANAGSRYLPLDASPMQIKLAARYQQTWLRTFTADCFA